MGKDKLRKFAENLTFKCMVQPEFDDIFHKDHPLKGRWHEETTLSSLNLAVVVANTP